MTITRPLTNNEAEIRKAMLRTLDQAPRPLTFRQWKVAYDAEGPDASDDLFRAIANLSVTAGAVHPCAGHRYWSKDERGLLLEEGRRLIAGKPRTKSGMVRELGRLDTGATKALREEIFEELRASPDIHVLPVLGDPRSLRLSAEPPRLEDYVGKARQEYGKALAALTSAGYGEADIIKAICGVDVAKQGAAGARGPGGSNGNHPARSLFPAREDDDLDFQRDASELLVYAWQDAASDEAREAIEDTLYSLGLDPIGTPGQVTDFDGRLQHTDSRLDPGKKVRVTRAGWELRNARGAHLIAKARVEPAKN